MSGEKTEQPTAKRLNQFREEGRVAKSQELGGILVLFCGVYLLAITGPRLSDNLAAIMRISYRSLSVQRAGTFSYETIESLFAQIGGGLIWSLIPWVGALMFVGVGVNLAQTRGLIQPRLLIPKWERLNPLSKAKQMFGAQLFVETGKGIAKQVAVALVVYFNISSRLGELLRASEQGLWSGILQLSQILYAMSLQACAVLLLIALFDYGWQLHRHRKSLMMSKEEVREETKNQDGSPEVKSRIRRIQREMTQQRMMNNVPDADVVVVNPTHFAVALQYDADAMDAPRIVAKGQDAVALRIMSLARRHGVPVVPNRLLARALVKLPLNTPVPSEFFQAVAEVLAFVYSLRQGSNR